MKFITQAIERGIDGVAGIPFAGANMRKFKAFLLIFLLSSGTGAWAAKYLCPDGGKGTVFIAARNTITNNTQLQALQYNAGGSQFNPVGGEWTSGQYNALAYHPTNENLYAVSYQTSSPAPGHLLKVNPLTGAVADLGQITGVALPPPNGPDYAGEDGFNTGAFDDAGNYWVADGGDKAIYKVDVMTLAATRVPLSGGNQIAQPDFTWMGGYLWNLTGPNGLNRIDVSGSTASVTNFTLPFSIGASDTYGAAWTYPNGDLAFMNNQTGQVSRVSVTNPGSANPTFAFVATMDGPANSGNDGAVCYGPSIDLSILKTASPQTVEPGGTITWTLTVKNNDATHASTGFIVKDTLPSDLTNVATTTSGCSIDFNVLTCSEGELAPGGEYLITITSKAPSTAVSFTNTATVMGNDPDDDPANNTSSATARVASIDVVKTVASGTPNPIGVNQDAVFDLTVSNLTTGTTYPQGYEFYEVVPQNTTFTGLTGGSTDCTLPAAAGMLCTITVSNEVANGTPQVLKATFHTANTLPEGTTRIFNVATKDLTPPTGCASSNAACTEPPTACPATNGTCAEVPTQTKPNAVTPVPVGDGVRWLLLVLLGAMGVWSLQRRRHH